VLLCFTASHSYSDTTGDLLDQSVKGGSYEICSGSDCWAGYSGGHIPTWNGGTARWGYGGGILSWNIAFQQAMESVGINIDGYNYAWVVKNGDANASQNDGDDFMRISVRFYDSSGSQLWGKQYNLDGTYDWSTFVGQELFADPLSIANVNTITVRAEGDDNGFWAGHYGPEFDVARSSVTLIYSADPCYTDPLSSPNCDGYAAAIAEMLAEQQAALSASLPTIEEPSIVVQTTPTEDPTTTSVSIQPSIVSGGTRSDGQDTGDTGSGSSEETANKENDSKQKLDLVRSLDPTSEYMPDVYAPDQSSEEKLVNDIIGSAESAAANTVSSLTQMSIESSSDKENNPVQQSFETQTNEQQFQEIGVTSNAMGMENSQAETGLGVDSLQIEVQSSVVGTQNNIENRQERRERLKNLVEKKASEIAKDSQEAEDMDEQSKQQMEQLALMNYVPGFDTYQTAIPGGFYPDVEFYKPQKLPSSRKGLRNGLAQQILHEEMVEMQYAR